MRTAIVFAVASASLACMTGWSGLPGRANNGLADVPALPPLPGLVSEVSSEPSEPLLYIQLAEALPLVRLAASLGLEQNLLAELNGQSMIDEQPKGSWWAVPAEHRPRLLKLTTVNPSSIRTTPPLGQSPGHRAVVQEGESLAAFLQRHGIEEIELKQLNPGVDLASMQFGRELRVPSASSTPMLAIRPSMSGGASWPEIPELSSPISAPQSDLKYQWPTKGVFTSGYGWRWGRMHKGIDIANNTGTSIHASRAGTVTHAGWMGAYGYLVEIAHDDGESTRYAHNSRLMVRKGQKVKQGTRIALMGSTGRSTGPHLHFEIRRRGGGASDLLAVLPPRQS